LTKRKNF